MTRTCEGKFENMYTNRINKNCVSYCLETVAFWLFCIIIIDCAFSGSGHWFRFGNLSLRMITGLLSVIFALPIFLRNLRNLKNSVGIIAVFCFLLLLVYALFNGIARKNPISLIVLDLRGFFWLGLLIVSFSVINTLERVKIVLACLLFGGLFQVLIINYINLLLIFDKASFSNIFALNEKIELGLINPVGHGIFRIFFRSNLYMGISFFLILYRFITNRNSINDSLLFFVPFIVIAILISFTRSTHFSIGMSLILFSVLVGRERSSKVLNNLGFLLIFTLLVSLIYIITIQSISNKNILGFAMQRTMPPLFKQTPLDFLVIDATVFLPKKDNDEPLKQSEDDHSGYLLATVKSDKFRITTKSELCNLIKLHPIMGNGLGSAIPSRGEGTNEYFILDLIAKMGVLGLLIFIFPSFLMLYRILTNAYSDQLLMITLFAGLSSFFIASYFNPYMNSALGLTYYSVIMAIERYLLAKPKISPM